MPTTPGYRWGRIVVALLLSLGSMTIYSLRGSRPNDSSISPTSEHSTEAPIDFELHDSFGNPYSLAQLRRDNKLVAVVFWGCDCPLVRLYSRTLNELATNWKEKGVSVVAINSNVQDSPTSIRRFIETEQITFPILKDAGNRVADLLNAKRTPEAFLIAADGKILYQGRIDDQFGIGYRKESPNNRYLLDAIIAHLARKQTPVPHTEPVGCLIGRSNKPTPTGTVTYSNQIARIFQKRCEECHREGEIAPFPLNNYAQAYGWAEMIGEVIDQERMPPWFAQGELGHFKNDPRLTPDEKSLVKQWITDGCPEGDPRDLPPRATFVSGWSIPSPTAVLAISDKPVKVPARGPFDYQTFLIKTDFPEDRWIAAAEARPGNRKVVHHIAIWILRDGMSKDDYSTSPCIAFAPGMPTLPYPEGTALLLPKGATIRYQIHYEPCGYETEDLSTLGLVFCRPDEVKSQILIDAIFPNDPINIPPLHGAYRLDGHFHFSRDALLFGLMPHMHLRGKSFRYVLSRPGYPDQTLLDLPRWDFGWQFWYLLPQAILVPKGSMLRSESIFDNSMDNPANPDPRQPVHWGPKTSDEMTVGVFAAIDPISQTTPPGEYRPPLEGFAAPIENQWTLHRQPHADATLVAGSHPYTTQRVIINRAGSNLDDLRLVRATTPTKKGLSYCLQFRAKSRKPRTIRFALSSAQDIQGNVGIDQTCQIGPAEQLIRHEFYATSDADLAQIRFDLGGDEGEVDLDGVVLLQGFHR